ncbi:MAG: N-acetylmuramoyl-L-alanine amidase [Eubacterium sp.]|nr:N-acetylmuramoyl-L-alanine amidase [Eubacterium sp.]
MKKMYLIICVLLSLTLALYPLKKRVISYVSAESSVSSRYTVVIDAGHGGKDAGTSGIDGTTEKSINLNIALILRDYLSVSGIKVELVREGDYELYPENSDRNRSDLYNRLDFVNFVDNAVLISIHQNHYSDESAKGTQIWYSANIEESKLYADLILNNVKSLLQSDNKRINKKSDSNYYLLYKASVPSIMIECGFMSNRDENEKLKDINYQKKFAYAILTGICGEI